MPLPAADSAWPPPAVADVFADYVEADAWYSGDKKRLAKVYGQAAGRSRDETWQQYSTRLWAQARDITRPEQRLHVPLAGDIAATSADLLAGEPPAITAEKTATQARLEEILDEGGFHMRLLEALEVCAGLGDVYLKVAWDEDLARRPIMAVEHGDAAVPTFRWGRLTEVTFWQELERTGDQVVRLLEHHEPGAITYAVYEGTSLALGSRVPLESREDTRRYAERTDADGRQETNTQLLTATHIPNIRPNRKHRGQPFGRSDYAAPCYDLFDALDLTWTSWMRDIRLARARLHVPTGYLEPLGTGQGASFDPDREVYKELNMDPSQAAGGGLTMTQFAIRVAEHSATTQAVVEQAVRAAGYSGGTFGIPDEGTAQTATEVSARRERSIVTRERKTRYVIPALQRWAEAALAVDRALKWSTVEPEIPSVVFPDAVARDPRQLAETVELLARAEAASIETRVRMAQPDLDDVAVAAEVQRIRDESGASVADPLGPGVTGAARNAFPDEPDDPAAE